MVPPNPACFRVSGSVSNVGFRALRRLSYARSWFRGQKFPGLNTLKIAHFLMPNLLRVDRDSPKIPVGALAWPALYVIFYTLQHPYYGDSLFPERRFFWTRSHWCTSSAHPVDRRPFPVRILQRVERIMNQWIDQTQAISSDRLTPLERPASYISMLRSNQIRRIEDWLID